MAEKNKREYMYVYHVYISSLNVKMIFLLTCLLSNSCPSSRGLSNQSVSSRRRWYTSKRTDQKNCYKPAHCSYICNKTSRQLLDYEFDITNMYTRVMSKYWGLKYSKKMLT